MPALFSRAPSPPSMEQQHQHQQHQQHASPLGAGAGVDKDRKPLKKRLSLLSLLNGKKSSREEERASSSSQQQQQQQQKQQRHSSPPSSSTSSSPSMSSPIRLPTITTTPLIPPPVVNVVSIEPAHADDGVGIPPMMVRRRRSSGEPVLDGAVSPGSPQSPSPTSPTSPADKSNTNNNNDINNNMNSTASNSSYTPSPYHLPHQVERRSSLRNVINFPTEDEPSSETTAQRQNRKGSHVFIDSDDEAFDEEDDDEEEEDDVDEYGNGSGGSSDDSAETLTPYAPPIERLPSARRRRAHFDPIQLAFLTTCKLNQERVAPMNNMKRVVMMQNLLHSIYGSWADLLPQSHAVQDGNILAEMGLQETEEDDDEEDEEEEEDDDSEEESEVAAGADEENDQASDTTEEVEMDDRGLNGDADARKSDQSIDLSSLEGSLDARRVVDKFLSSVDGSTSPTSTTASFTFPTTAPPPPSPAMTALAKNMLAAQAGEHGDAGVSMKRSQSDDAAVRGVQMKPKRRSRGHKSVELAIEEDDDDDVPLGQIAARQSMDSNVRMTPPHVVASPVALPAAVVVEKPVAVSAPPPPPPIMTSTARYFPASPIVAVDEFSPIKTSEVVQPTPIRALHEAPVLAPNATPKQQPQQQQQHHTPLSLRDDKKSANHNILQLLRPKTEEKKRHTLSNLFSSLGRKKTVKREAEKKTAATMEDLEEVKHERRHRRSYSASEADARKWALEAAGAGAGPMPAAFGWGKNAGRNTPSPPPSSPTTLRTASPTPTIEKKVMVTVACQTDPVEDEDFAWETETVAEESVHDVENPRRSRTDSERTSCSDPSTLAGPLSPGAEEDAGIVAPPNSRSSKESAVASRGPVGDDVRQFFSDDEIREFSGLLDGVFVPGEEKKRRFVDSNATIVIPSRTSSMIWDQDAVAAWSASSSPVSPSGYRFSPVGVNSAPVVHSMPNLEVKGYRSSPVSPVSREPLTLMDGVGGDWFVDSAKVKKDKKKEAVSLDEVFRIGWSLDI
ncbi:hypothetical protein HDU97_009330 [Phlyctochytrium planicorne]|nr:hypothetical protein HDU97_009330 [Phlyctochytrium planicorne]